jgi:hypothetical protein
MDALPRTAMMKVDKAALGRMAREVLRSLHS